MRHSGIGPTLLVGTAVLLLVAAFSTGWLPLPSRASRSAPAATNPATALGTLLLLRPEPSPTGVPTSNIWAVTIDGSDLRRITNEPRDVLDFAVSPDGKSIIYVARDDGGATVLWRINSDGTGRTRLTAPSAPAVYADPAWSPAGDAVLYTRRDFVYLNLPTGATLAPGASRAPAIGVPRIWAMRPDGTPLRQIYGVGDETGEGAIWSPDGAAVAFRTGGPGSMNLAITDFASSPITVQVGSVARMSWSPDGRRLAYDAPVPTGNGRSRINLIGADGSGQKPLLDDTMDSDIAPVWSPDGTALAFLRRARGTPAADAVGAAFAVWTVTPDGKLGRQLFGSDGLASEALAWSPDGRMLAATRYTVTGAAARGVWVVGADGGGARELVKDATHPIWVPHA